MEASRKYNLRNPAVKRILQEMKEMQRDTSQEFVAEALEDNIFEWQFVICGPVDTEFEGGLYHGRIILPSEYPFKPPSFVMLTESGRFEVGKKICLSISERHPEHWQPSWSMRTALMALVAFLPTQGKGAIGSLDSPKEERRKLAQRSRSFIPSFGNEDRQEIASRIHAEALRRQKEEQTKQKEKSSSSDMRIEDDMGTRKPVPDVRPSLQSSKTTVPKPETQSQVSHRALPARETNSRRRTSISRTEITTNQHLQVSNGVNAVGDNDRAWSVIMWAVGVLIIAILTKKVLFRVGVDVWSFIG